MPLHGLLVAATGQLPYQAVVALLVTHTSHQLPAFPVCFIHTHTSEGDISVFAHGWTLMTAASPLANGL